MTNLLSQPDWIGSQLLLMAPLLAWVAVLLALVATPLFAGRGPKPMAAMAVAGWLFVLLAVLYTAGAVATGGAGDLLATPGSGMLIVDNLSVGFMLVLLVFLAGVLLLWWTNAGEAETDAPELLILLFGSGLGMALMASTANLLFMVMAIETASLASYALVGFDKRSRLSAEASLKYVVFGGICSAIMLYGISLLYGLTGTLSVAGVAEQAFSMFNTGRDLVLLSVGLLCLMAGIAFKISAVPFHFWCPDAFQGARIEVTTWLSVASKAAGLVLLARLVLTFCAAAGSAQGISTFAPLAWAIGILAMVTCTYGNFCAYHQQSVKRLLAYSSIAHAGYMLMAVAVFAYVAPGDAGAPLAGVSALLTYVVIYLFMNLGAFGVTALVQGDTGSDDLSAFTGLARRSPLLTVVMVICLMSLVGLPPLAGFVGKWWILLALGEWASQPMGRVLGWTLVVVMVLNTLISLFYYMRVVVRMGLHDDQQRELRPGPGGQVLVTACAVILLAMFFFAQPVKDRMDGFARSVYVPRSAQADWVQHAQASIASPEAETFDGH